MLSNSHFVGEKKGHFGLKAARGALSPGWNIRRMQTNSLTLVFGVYKAEIFSRRQALPLKHPLVLDFTTVSSGGPAVETESKAQMTINLFLHGLYVCKSSKEVSEPASKSSLLLVPDDTQPYPSFAGTAKTSI